MKARLQISLDSELLAAARSHAAGLGISLAEYVRRALARELEGPGPKADPSLVFNLGDSGGSDVVRQKDGYVGEAVTAESR